MSFIYSTSLGIPEFLIREVPCSAEVQVGDVVRMGTSEVVPALADNINNCNVIGLVESLQGGICNIRTMGITGLIFDGLSTATDYYLSSTQPGKLTTTAPLAPGSVVLKLGQAVDSQRLLVFRSVPLVRG